MLTNALHRNVSEFGLAAPHCQPETTILPIARLSTTASKNQRDAQIFTIGTTHGRPQAESSSTVEVSPASSVKRRMVRWSGMAAEIVQSTSRGKTEFRFRAPVHLLILCERGTRQSGQTVVEGLPPSRLRDVTRKLTFVPAGHEYSDCHDQRSPLRLVFFYIDPSELSARLPASGSMDSPMEPILLFEDATLLATAQKLIGVIERTASDDQTYLEALGRVLSHEVSRVGRGNAPAKQVIRGGLAAWQQRMVSSYIDEHLAEPISLETLSGLVGLSTYHFCRAFKQSFGVPPHRYHTGQRIAQAKALLAKPALSVTEIGLTLGFSETSSFTAAFRKATGLTPSAYHRSLT